MQPPRGQGYGAQQPGGYGAQQPGGYGPQSGPPQYGFTPQSVGYNSYTPQKRGMPVWAWILIAGGIVVVGIPLLIGVLVVFMAPAGGGAKDARRMEGEQLMNMTRDTMRLQYAMNRHDAPATFAWMQGELQTADYTGRYFRVNNARPGIGFDAEVTCTPVTHLDDEQGRAQFNWSGGASVTDWR